MKNQRLKAEYGNVQVFWLDEPYYNEWNTLIDIEIRLKKQLTLDL